MRKTYLIRVALCVAVLCAVVGPARAGLLGSTVDITANYPTATSVLVDPGNRLVTNGIEYPTGTYGIYSTSWQLDVTNDQLVIQNMGAGFPFLPATFNGFVMKVISGPAIASASVRASSDFSPIAITVLNGNELDINYAGVSHANTFAQSIIDIQFVPEPSSAIALALCGAALLHRNGRA